VLTVDLHAGQIQGFFDIPVDHLYAMPVMIDHLKNDHLGRDTVIVSPDAGGVERARAYSKRLNATLAIIDKRREKANVSEVMNIIGEVKGKDAILVDDIIDTAGTLAQAATALHEAGARTGSACRTHVVLSGPAVERIEKSPIVEPWSPTRFRCGPRPRVEQDQVASVARILDEAIKRNPPRRLRSPVCSFRTWRRTGSWKSES
jgi:ribose-phosphate pyrophosphokinase